MLPHDLRYAFRSLLRQPGFTLVAIITLALGTGATTAIFSVVDAILLRPLPYPDSERIVALWQGSPKDPPEQLGGQVSTPNFTDWRAGTTSFEAMALYRRFNVTLASEDGAELIPGAEVTPEFFRVFAASPVRGRTFTDEETRFRGPKSTIISHGFWQERLGGRADVIGNTLQLEGATYEIVGVVPDGFDYPNGARIWLPVQNDDAGCGRGCVLFAGVGLLRSDATLARARAELDAVSTRLQREFPDENVDETAELAPLRDVVVGSVELALLVVFAAVGMVLLIACANVANLLLVRGAARQREMAVRAALGAGRTRLMRQMVTESAVLAIAGMALGIILAIWGVAALRGIAPDTLPRTAGIVIDGRALAFSALVASMTVALFGLFPALQVSRTAFVDTLRQGGRGATSARQRMRAAILTIEVALSVLLLLGAGLMLRSLLRIYAVDPGFDTNDVAHFSVTLPDARYSDPTQAVQFVERVRNELAALPGVENAAFIVGMPLGRTQIFGSFARADRPEPAPGETPNASYRVIDEHYLATLRIPVLAGRSFLPSDRHDSAPVALIDQLSADRYFPGEDPLGRQIDVHVSVGHEDTLPRTIVGVVGTVHARSLTQQPEPAVYVPQSQAGSGFGAFVIRSRLDGDGVLRVAREVVRAVDAQIPLARPGTMAELIAADAAQRTFYLLLLSAFATLAMALAAVGIYGVVAFVVAQRTREIGVRIALGARAREVVALVVLQGLKPALLGAIIGIAAGFAARRVLARLLYQTAPQDALTLLGVTGVLLAVVAIACTIPARRATRIPPAAALRAE